MFKNKQLLKQLGTFSSNQEQLCVSSYGDSEFTIYFFCARVGELATTGDPSQKITTGDPNVKIPTGDPNTKLKKLPFIM